jgi:hypothetical protein
MRSGINNQELVLTPAKVSTPGAFGLLFRCQVDGYAYAQPLYVPNLSINGAMHNVVVVATEMDSVYAFDADANLNPCVPLWHTSLVPPGSQALMTPSPAMPNVTIVPWIGITGTPVIDANSKTLYVAAASTSSNSGVNPTYSEKLYALDLATGLPVIQPNGKEFSTPVLASLGAAFSPLVENQRAALLLDNGNVYVAFGGYESQDNYHGWLLEYSAASMAPLGAFNVTPVTGQGGIWQSGGGPAADATHNVFVVTGDGPFNLNASQPSYGDSFLRFATSNGLSVSDYFSPCNQATLQASGLDVGASAPLLLDVTNAAASAAHLMIGGSKGGTLYVVSRDRLGGYNCPDSLSGVQTVTTGNAVFGTPIFWNNSVYVAPANEALQSFSMSNTTLSLTPSGAVSPEKLGPLGATPTISANGTGNAIVWLIDASGTNAILRAFDASNLSSEIYNSSTMASRDTAGLAVKFTVPTVANGKVYIGTQGELDVYGLLH